MMLLIKQVEDILHRWDKRIQFEATLLFFFSIVSGSSFISLWMFWHENFFIILLPFLYLIVMSCWWYICKKMILDTEETYSSRFSNDIFKFTNITSIIVWFIISCAVSFGGWDEWGWNMDESFPAIDNIYRFINCMLLLSYIFTLYYDFYQKIESRIKRIKLWMFYIWIHAIISFGYFGEWLEKGYNHAKAGDGEEKMGARWLAAVGSATLILLGLAVFFMKQMNKYVLTILFLSLLMYWMGSASLDCEFYADTADMTVMPGYQMLWSMAILILLESVPTMANDIYVLGGSGLLDDDEDDDIDYSPNDVTVDAQISMGLDDKININQNDDNDDMDDRKDNNDNDDDNDETAGLVDDDGSPLKDVSLDDETVGNNTSVPAEDNPSTRVP